MTRPRAAGVLSRSDIDKLLRRPLLARLATVDSGGYPSIVPVWHHWDGEAAWLVARAAARYVADIQREPRVGLSVVADDDLDVRVQLRGRATIVEGPGPLTGRMLEIARAMADRYEGPEGLSYIEESREWPRCLVRIDPVRLLAWGSSDWHDRYKQTDDTDPGRPIR